MTIYEIIERTKVTAPYFFNKKTMKFFGQTIGGFSVEKQSDGRYKISQKMKDKNAVRGEEVMGNTIRYFNPQTNDLEHENY